MEYPDLFNSGLIQTNECRTVNAGVLRVLPVAQRQTLVKRPTQFRVDLPKQEKQLVNVLPLPGQDLRISSSLRWLVNTLRKLTEAHLQVIPQNRQPTCHARFCRETFQVRNAPSKHVVALLKLVRYNHPGMLGFH